MRGADPGTRARKCADAMFLNTQRSARWKVPRGSGNQASHGAEIDLDSVIPTIMVTKLLKIILHRIVLKITGRERPLL